MARPFSVTPASHSSMSAYETCPKQFYHTRVIKDFVQGESAEMAWGNAVHKALENAIKYGRPLPGNMTAYQWGLDLFANKKIGTVMHAELSVAVTRAFEPTGFWDNAGFMRGKIDVVALSEDQRSAINGDWKTGKTKPNSAQLALSTLLCFHTYAELERMKTVFVWLPETDKKKRTTQKLYVRHDSDRIDTTDERGNHVVTSFEEMWEPFINIVDQMEWSLQHDTWPANPSGLCKKWCPVLSCPHNGLRK